MRVVLSSTPYHDTLLKSTASQVFAAICNRPSHLARRDLALSADLSGRYPLGTSVASFVASTCLYPGSFGNCIDGPDKRPLIDNAHNDATGKNCTNVHPDVPYQSHDAFDACSARTTIMTTDIIIGAGLADCFESQTNGRAQSAQKDWCVTRNREAICIKTCTTLGGSHNLSAHVAERQRPIGPIFVDWGFSYHGKESRLADKKSQNRALVSSHRTSSSNLVHPQSCSICSLDDCSCL
jgi:hypothetical protein